jgi:hypothetical protein
MEFWKGANGKQPVNPATLEPCNQKIRKGYERKE